MNRHKALALVAGIAMCAVSASAHAADNRLSNPDAVIEGTATQVENWGGLSRSYISYTAWNVQPIDASFTYNYANSAAGQTIFRTGAGNPWASSPCSCPRALCWKRSS